MNQHLRVSVLVANHPLGHFYVDLFQGRLRFHSPERLFDQLEGIHKKKTVLHLLKRNFALNIECLSNGTAALPHGCKDLEKQSIYLIFNPAQEVVHLFLSQSYFKKPGGGEKGIEFIPDSTASWSYINKLGAAGSFSSDTALPLSRIYPSTPNYYNLYSNNVLAYGNSSLIGNISQNNGINNGQHFQIQNLYVQTISRDKIYSGGYIVNPSSPFFQTQILAGAGVKTTLDTVKNSVNITASPLIVFIPPASQVSIFKNDQLIFSEYLSPGYQTINTSNFPDGGYELTIKIGTSVSRRFFTKGFSLPPIQAPQFYLIGGYLTNGMILNNNGYNFLPKLLPIPVIQAGFNKRINQKLALMTDFLLNSKQGLLDFGPSFFWGNSFVKTAVLLTTKNNYGFYTMMSMQRRQLNLNLVATKILYKQKKPNYFFLNNLIDNDSISISYQLSEKDLFGVQANYTKTIDQPKTYGAGTFYQRQIGRYQGMIFFFNAAYNQGVPVGNSYFLSLSMTFSEGQFAGTEALLWQNQTKKVYSSQLAVPVAVQGSTTYSNQNEQGIGSSFNELHTLSSTASSLAGIYNYTAPQGFLSSYLNYSHIQREGNTLGYGGSIETELAWNQNGIQLNGVERGNSAGMIVQVASSNPEDRYAQFALLDINNRKIAILPANKKAFISLPGFIDQNYTLINLSNSDYSIHEPTQHITLYPGNIGYHTWWVEKRIIVIGRAVKKGKNLPLPNVWIHATNTENGVFSDEEGYFQLELSQSIASLTFEGSEICQINLPKLTINKDYLYIGDISC